MTRVLMTADAVGGVWTYALELADALAPMGVEVHLAVLGPGPSAGQLEQVERSAVVSCEVRPFALEWMPRPWVDVDASRQWLLELAERIGPDVVHLNGYALAALEWPAPTVVVAHSDVASWWRAVHGVPAPAEWDEYRTRVAAGLRAADAVVAPTAAVLADLAREYDVSRGRVVHNGRRSDRVERTSKEPLVLAAGRAWDEAKNLAALDRIAPALPWPVAIAGEGGSAGRFLGPLGSDDLNRWMQRAAVFVAPALYEPFGLAILEAAGAGCALVLADLPSLREVWADAALYVPPREEAALLSALNHLIGDPRRLGELAERARRRAVEYTAERMAGGYLDVYSELAVAVPS